MNQQKNKNLKSTQGYHIWDGLKNFLPQNNNKSEDISRTKATIQAATKNSKSVMKSCKLGIRNKIKRRKAEKMSRKIKVMFWLIENNTQLERFCNYAYKEACLSRNNFEKFTWSHPIIFYIGSKTGWDYLWTQAEKETFTEFKLNYDLLVNEYLEGKEFSKPKFPELPKTLRVKVDKKSQLKKIQDLKNKLIN